MHKLLLTLVAFSSGVLCNAEQYVTETGIWSLDPIEILNNTENLYSTSTGQLAILNSDREAGILYNLMKRENVRVTWIGIHDQFEEGDWVTLNGETLEAAGYKTWNTLWPNQPDNKGGNENCGALINMNGLNDISCDTELAYICEIPIC